MPVKSLVSVLCGLVLGRDVRGGLASLDGAKCTLRGGFLSAIGTGALAAIFAILIVSWRSCSAFTFCAQFFKYLKYQALRPQHTKPKAVRPPTMTAMVSLPFIMEMSGKISPCSHCYRMVLRIL